MKALIITRSPSVSRAATTPSVARTRIATSAKAMSSICEPNWLIVSADHSLRKSPWRQSPPFGQRLRIALLVEGDCEGVRLAVGSLGGEEVVEDAPEASLEPEHVAGAQPDLRVAELHRVGRLLDLDACTAQERTAEGAGIGGILAFEEEQARRASVELLGQGSDLAGADDVDQAGLLEHLQVMPNRALGDVELACKLLRGTGTVAEERDDRRADVVRERPKLNALGDDEDVEEVVVGRTVDDRGTYGKSRPFATNPDTRRAGVVARPFSSADLATERARPERAFPALR